jgi:hypothetical protein
VKALESVRDDALLAASKEIPLPELSAATGLSKDRAMRLVNRASRRAARPLGLRRSRVTRNISETTKPAP